MPGDEVVLLTGYPAMLGRSVCREILRANPEAQVHAVVRPKFLDEARADLEALPEADRCRVRVLEGDAAAIDMGLAGEDYRALARIVTRVHHCAHVSYVGTDRKVAESVNIGGAREAVEFALACERLECLVHHSTAEVAGNRVGVVYEDDLEAGQSFRSFVEESRARAEKLVRAAMSKVPIAMLRPSTIVGHSKTGEVDRLDGPYLLALLVVTTPADLALPLPGLGDEPLNVVPVDWAAKASVAIGRDARAVGHTFHVVDRHPMSARRAFDLMARAGGRRALVGSIPANLAKVLLRTPGLDRVAKSPRAFLDTLTTSVTYESSRTTELLSSLAVEPCPALETYISKMIEVVQKRVHRRRSTKRGEEGVERPL